MVIAGETPALQSTFACSAVTLRAMLAAVAFDQPLFWALMIGWIMSVVIHEFAHGIVAYWGGDYTVRERGGLTLNPLQYIDPLTSLLMPAIFLLIGGVPLPGGATYIRRDLLRNGAWETAMSLAGPASNFLMCALCLLPFHPAIGWIDVFGPLDQAGNFAIFLGAMAMLQFLAGVFNLIPVPPLDGFQALGPWMNQELREKLGTPPTSTMLFIGLFILIISLRGEFSIFQRLYVGMMQVMEWAGFGWGAMEFVRRSFNAALFGVTD